ncbi:MAG TPA: GGDEF domain-containing protein [Rhodanobacteraceae bacterium]
MAISTDRFRRRVLLAVIATALLATVLAWYLMALRAPLSPSLHAVQLVTTVVLSIMLVLGWSGALSQRALELCCVVYIVGVCAVCMALRLYSPRFGAGIHIDSLYLWIPLGYLFAFMLTSHRGGLYLSLSIFALFLGVSLPYLVWHPNGDYANFTVQLHVASAVMIATLYFFSSYQYRLRLAEVEVDQFAHLSNTDDLTGLPNRRRMAALIAAGLAPAAPHRGGFALMLFDIDHFKAVNDHFGHLGGDATLVALATRANEFFHGMGTLGRWGGDEFLAIVHGVDAAAAVRMAEALCVHVAAEPLAQRGGVTISCGVTVVRARDNIDNLLQRADAALYAAKRAGRNGVASVFEPTPDSASA